MTFEMIRSVILLIGWPFLIAGSVIIVIKAYHFYQKTNKLALGRLIMAETFGVLVSMYSLGLVSTAFMFHDVEEGVRIVLPIFLVWFVVMVAIYLISERWRDEAAKINILYYRIKERSEKLKQEKEKLIQVAQNMSTGAILLDNAGKPMFINREAKEIIGSKSNNEGRLLKLLFKKFAKYRLKAHVDNCLAGKPSNIMDAEAGDRIYEICLRCLIGHASQANGYFGHFIWIRDVTDEKMLLRAEDSFLTVASHKLRTPLTGIRQYTDLLLRDKKCTARQKEYLSDIKSCADIMADVVNQLLYASEASIRKLKINPKKTQLDQLLKKAVNELKPIARKKKIKIIYRQDSEAAYDLLTDADLLLKVLKDVLNNAIIYSTDKKPEVTVHLKKENGNKYQIIIADNGIGIPKMDHDKIFTKFFRSENALKVHTEGLGINLNTDRRIVRSLGGQISFESKLNKGTAFTISLPGKPPKK